MNLDDFTFEKVEGGYALTKYNRKWELISCVVIPDHYQGEPVVELGEKVFFRSAYLEKIHIPSTVKKVGEECFCECKKLRGVVIPDSVTELGERTFADCTLLHILHLPRYLTEIPTGLCRDCHFLLEVILPEQVKIIKPVAFYDCVNLKKITLSRHLIKIERLAFGGCESLEVVHLPKKIALLAKLAFRNCKMLKEIHLENTDAFVGKNAFKQCTAVKKASVVLLKGLDFTVQSALTLDYVLEFDRLSARNKEIILKLLKNNTLLQHFIFTSDAPKAIACLLCKEILLTLEEVDGYLEVSIAEKRTEITGIFLQYKQVAFSEQERVAHQEHRELQEMGFLPITLEEFRKKWVCHEYESGIYISGYKGSRRSEVVPAQIEDGIKIQALINRDKDNFAPLEKIIVESPIRIPDYRTFDRHTSLKEVVLPDNLEVIPPSLFFDCTRLQEISIPESVHWIRMTAFCNCVSLKNVIFQGLIPKIDPDVFQNCTSLEYVGREDGVNLLSQFTI